MDRLVEAGARQVIVFDKLTRGRPENLERALASGTVTIVEGDIRDSALVADVMRGIDVVFHQAAIRITQCAEEPRLALEVMVDGTFNVLEAASVRRRSARSSRRHRRSVYGMAENFPTPETHHPYGNARSTAPPRRSTSLLLRSFHDMYGLDYVALRYFNVYGPRMDIHGPHTEVLVRWMERIAGGRAAADPRRRDADHGLRLRRGRGAWPTCSRRSPR